VPVGESLPKQVLDSAVDPTEIVQQSFDLERRGFDQRQVQAYLRAIADSLRDAQQREAEMRTRLGRAVRRAEAAEQTLRDAPTHDPAELNRQFGDEVAGVLDAARVAGEQRVAVAEKSAGKLMASAKAEATRMRAAADTTLKERRAEADLAAKEIIGDGQAEAKSIRKQARVDADATLAQAADRVQRARDECDGLIREAEEARAQILEDMERRRRQARAQVERLRVGRDRLLRSYDVVRRTLEETTVELKSSLNEAKVRGDGAARAVTAEPPASREQLEAELRDAKMIGRITISDPGIEAPAAGKPGVGGAALRSPALPRRLDTPEASTVDASTSSPPTHRRPRVSEAKKRAAISTQPKAPAAAPLLKASPADAEAPKDPIAAMIDAAEAKRAGTAAPVSASFDGDAIDEPVDAELADLEDDNLNVVELSDAIEEVVAVAMGETSVEMPAEDAAGRGLFAALRSQRSAKQALKTKTLDAKPEDETDVTKAASRATVVEVDATEVAEHEVAGDDVAVVTATTEVADQELAAADESIEASLPEGNIPGIEAQRDAVIADAAKQLERRLKRALADEQNDLLAGIRAAKKKRVALTTIVGDVDAHVNRYVLAINEVAVVTYGAGAALIDAEAIQGHLPAGAVEELLASDVVLPIRQRLESLDGLEVDVADAHMDPVRAFYRQRKTEHLGFAASRLASLLCVAGLCDALPPESTLPWVTRN
jgi:cell division septum initiation protein DivIVA